MDSPTWWLRTFEGSLTFSLMMVGFLVIPIIIGVILNRRDARTAENTKHRLDEIEVVVGEGFVPTPILSFDGEADIQRQIDEIKAGGDICP